jgi:ATP-binding cassette subfamily B protein
MAVLVWSFHPLLALSALMLFIPALVQFSLNKRRVNLDLSLSPARREAGVFKAYLTERAYLKDIRMMHTGDFFLKKWESVTQHIIQEERRSNIKITLVRLLLDVIERGVTISAYALCVYLVLLRKIGVPEFGAVIVLMGQFIDYSTWFMRMINNIHERSLSLGSAIGYFDLPTESRTKTLGSVNAVSLNNVSYTYPEAKKSAVKNINITLKKGETLALVGKNGSGKTTLSKLILGLINPSQGEVNADGRSMREIDYPSLYSPSSAVFQDYVRYAMSVGDNIAIAGGRKPLSPGETYLLLKKMGIGFVNENSEINLQTELGVEFGGVDLSGGQWQQLAIARAAYRDAELVVLDEPSSALDPLREAELYDTFRRLCQNRIGVIITHRLGMCAFADKILVMDEGEAVEYGTREELLLNNGFFARMHRSQGELYAGTVSCL